MKYKNPYSLLKELNLAHCHIGNEGVALIINSLVSNISLQRLHLISISVTPRGFRTLFMSLINCKIFLMHLDFLDNMINHDRLDEKDREVLGAFPYIDPW